LYVLAPPVRVPSGRDAQAPVAGAPIDSSDLESPDSSPHESYALLVSRLAPEKGIDVAIDACRIAGVPLVVAGDGPEMGALRAYARARAGHDVRFVGHVDDAELERLRRGAALAIVPSRSAETFGMAAAEAMAAGVPVVASRVGALPELVEERALVEPGDPGALAQAIGRLWGDTAAGERGRARVGELCAPEVVAAALGRIYGEAIKRPASP
jgi:glycosyltransferase involved in cell wall biosynthesis